MQASLVELFGLKVVSEQGNLTSFESTQAQFDGVCFNLQSHYSYLWLVDVVVIDSPENLNRFSFKYIFLNVEQHDLFSIQFEHESDSILKSIAHMWRNASSFEQEISELYGIKFSRKYKDLYNVGTDIFPMRKDFNKLLNPKKIEASESEYDLVVSPSQLLKRNQYELKLDIKNNIIDKCHSKSGSFHIGLEKIFEKNDIKNNYNILEAYFPNKAITWSHLLSVCVESIHGIEITNRSKAIRMVLLELNRVLNHVQFLSEISYEFCMESLYRYSLIWLKRIQSLILSYTGNEFGINTIRFGGVTKDVSQDWLSRTINEVVWLEGSILSAYKNIIKNAYTKSSFDFQLISKKVAGAWSVTGPLVRAVGINLDYRKLSPFYYYNDVEFDIPIGVKGTGYDLLVVRVEEIFQSIKIIVQVLDNLPTGQIMNESINEHLYFKDGSMELDEDKYRESVKNYLDIKNVSGTQLLEGSNGLMSLTVNQSVNTVNRLKVGTSSFYLKTLFERVIKGSEVNIVKPFWSVLDINLKEAER